MTHHTSLSLGLMLALLSLSTRVDARGAGGGGGHGHMSTRHRFRSTTPQNEPGHELGHEPKREPVKEKPERKSPHEYDIPAIGTPANITIGCSYASDTAACEKVMNDNGAVQGKDLQQLAALSLQMVHLTAVDMEGSVNRYREENATLPEAQVRALEICSNQYSSARAFAANAVNGFFSGQYEQMAFWLGGAAASASSCEQAVAPTRPNNLVFAGDANSNINFAKLCDSALSIVTTYKTATEKPAV